MSNMRYSIHPSTNPREIPADAASIHLVRPVKKEILAKLIEKCNLREISLSKSCNNRLGRKIKKLIKEKGIALREEENRGRPIGIELEKVMEIVEMHRDDKTYREIEEKLGVPKSTAHYLIRYADRNKLKKGSRIIYLE